MKILRCPRCGVWPANDITIPKGVDSAGFTTVTRMVRCPGCGNTLEGDSRSGSFLGALAEWKVNYEDLQEPETDADPEPEAAEPEAAESEPEEEVESEAAPKP